MSFLPALFIPAFRGSGHPGPGRPPRYLVEDYAVAYLSSASLLKTLRDAQARKQVQPSYPLLAFANPRYGKPSSQHKDKPVRGLRTRAYENILGGTFEELKETEDEARAIQELLQAPDQSQPLLSKKPPPGARSLA